MVSFDASEIVNWSDLPDAHHQMPGLVRRLVQAAAKVLDIDMPSGSSVRLGGWDGLVTAADGGPWVPEGHSGWEFSCNKAPGAKATGDYDKRTADPLSVEVTNATFVFVTSRRWPGKREWARERREQGPWADVRAFDADDLVAWLEQAPEVGKWFAKILGHSSPDMAEIRELLSVKGGDRVGHWGGGIVYHRHERLTSVDQTEGRQWRSRNGQRCQRVMRCPGLRELGARRSRGCA